MFDVFRSRFTAAVALTFALIVATPSEAGAQAAPVLPTGAGWTIPAKSPIAMPSLKLDTAISAPAAPVSAMRPVTPGRYLPQQPRSLESMVASYVDYGDQGVEEECLAKAVYFEARSESLEGQLAVADVVLNRAKSGVYPATICEVVTQPWQFSFIRQGRFPTPDRSSRAWHDAAAIASIAHKRLMQVVPPNVLWYHANYVAPSWGRRLTRVTQIGAHIFYS